MCKNLSTWHAYPDVSVLGRKVMTWRDWRFLLLQPNCFVADESGDEYQPHDIIARVESMSDSERDRPYQLRIDYTQVSWFAADKEWQDVDGYFFVDGDFC